MADSSRNFSTARKTFLEAKTVLVNAFIGCDKLLAFIFALSCNYLHFYAKNRLRRRLHLKEGAYATV